jgi:hypothetical protein
VGEGAAVGEAGCRVRLGAAVDVTVDVEAAVADAVAAGVAVADGTTLGAGESGVMGDDVADGVRTAAGDGWAPQPAKNRISNKAVRKEMYRIASQCITK